MAFQDSNWPCGGDDLDLSSWTSEVQVNWNIKSFLGKCRVERNNLKSDGFAFAGAIWNLFASFDGKEGLSLFGINVRGCRPLDSVLDCYCNITFDSVLKDRGCRALGSALDCYCNTTCHSVLKKPKNIIFKFKCEGGGSYCAVENFFSKSKLNTFLLSSSHTIKCKIIIKNLKEIENYPMVFPDSTWPCGGDDLKVSVDTPEEGLVTWTIKSFLSECLGEKLELSSDGFSFAGATWNLFASFDRRNIRSIFGVSVREYRSSNTVLDCSCNIKFKETTLSTIRHIVFKFKVGSANSQCSVEDFLPNLLLIAFLTRGADIVCKISVKKSSVKEASPQADAQLQENKDEEENPKIHPTYKLRQDFKNLLLSEEGSDVTIQVGDQQFKAHRLVLAARSSVFAAMFRHDTKEKATGVVDVEDCKPSSFPVLLEFLYSSSVEKLSVENVFDVYTAADKYDVQDLKIECLEFIKNNLSTEFFCDAVRFSLTHSETNLLNLSINFFARNMEEIIKTAKWQSFNIENPSHANEILINAVATNFISRKRETNN